MSDTEQKRIFSNNLNYYLAKNNLQQKEVANSIGAKPTTFNMWCKGQAIPRSGMIQALADYFGIAKGDLVDEKDFSVSEIKGVKIPVLGYVVAGLPIEAVENIIDYEEIPLEMSRQGEFFGLKIKGHSMEPRICEGDIVIVRKQSDVESGDIAIVLVNGDKATCKKITKTETGINLVPLNTLGFEVKSYSDEQIMNLPVTILGKVVELRGKF
jgi:repressor LexA